MASQSPIDSKNAIDPQVLNQAVEIAKKLFKDIESEEDRDVIKNKLLENKEFLLNCLAALLQDKENLDPHLIKILESFLGIETKEEEKDKEEELTEEQKQMRLRQIIYEAYKIVNPERLAGETSLENFISNVITRGIEVALEYDGKEYAKEFTSKELSDLESNKESFVAKLKSEGHKGGGRGL